MKNPTDFSFVADALLAMCESPADRPFYTEQVLRQRFSELSCDTVIYFNLAAGRQDDELFRREFEAVFEQAKLTERQRQVMGRKLKGQSFETIGSALGVSKQSVQGTFTHGLKKLHRALRGYPYAGLSDVYRSETHRGSIRQAA